jgi:RpiR family transcriptional regulator, carbohydrate utilization regulator
VDDTFETLNEQVLGDVARCLSHADTTLVVAAGASHGAGSYLASSLQIIGVRTVLPTGMADAALALATLGSGDVMVGLSLWYLASTVEIVAHAKQDAGATTIVLTDSAVSSATQSADHVLVVSASTVGPRLSMTGLIALTEVIVARTALVDPRRSRAAAARASDLYLHGYILGDPAPRPSQESRWSWAERPEEEIGRA